MAHQRPHHWGTIGGITLTAGTSENSKLRFASHVVHDNRSDNQLTWPLNGQGIEPSDTWNASIAAHRHEYSTEQKLGDNVTTLIWGLAASPFGDCLAVSYSLLPKDMLVYAMSVHQSCNVIISGESIGLPFFRGVLHDSQHQCGKYIG